MCEGTGQDRTVRVSPGVRPAGQRWPGNRTDRTGAFRPCPPVRSGHASDLRESFPLWWETADPREGDAMGPSGGMRMRGSRSRDSSPPEKISELEKPLTGIPVAGIPVTGIER